MQTFFSPAQLADPGTADANVQLRACVHCGFCTATCPTYLLLGDELDSPRGRIYLIKEMLEKELEPPPGTIIHLDRCLTCLSCQTTCGAGVNYMHLLDHARAYIEQKKARPAGERFLRAALVKVLTDRMRERTLLAGSASKASSASVSACASSGCMAFLASGRLRMIVVTGPSRSIVVPIALPQKQRYIRPAWNRLQLRTLIHV